MVATLIDGKQQAAQLLEQVNRQAHAFASAHGRQPGLAVVLVGNDPASTVYVRNKQQQAQSCGFANFATSLDVSTSQDDLLALIKRLNANNEVDGILVQLPLPKHIDTHAVTQAIDPRKDVDGFHSHNTGLLYQGQPNLVPCTPLGCLHLLKSVHAKLSGMHALVIGRSNIVGRPLAALLLGAHMTVTIAHSHSRETAALARSVDVVCAAAGVPHLVQADWVTKGATVIDVGIHRVEDASKTHGYRLIGDVAPEVADVAGWLTPVPGGVGPMTIAYLLINTLHAAEARASKSMQYSGLRDFSPIYS